MSPLARSTSYAFLAALGQQGFAVLQFLLLARVLAPEALGTWAMFVTLTSFADMARLGLVQNAMIHFGARDERLRPFVASAGLVLNLAVSLAAAALLYGISLIFNEIWQMPDLPALFIFYPILALAFGYVRFSDAARMMHGDFRGMFLSAALFGGFYLAATVGVWFWRHSLTLAGLVGLQILAALAVPPALRMLRATPVVFGPLRKKWVFRLLNFGRYGLGTNLFSMLFQRVDLLLLGAFVAPASVAVYNVATRLVGYLDLPLTSLGQAIFPKMSAEKHRPGGGDIAGMFEQSVGLLFALSLPGAMLVVLFAKPLVLILAGNAYLDAVPLVQILALAALAKPWGRMFGVTLDAIGKPKWNFRMLLASFFLTLVLNLLLIPPRGLFGAAAATVLSTFMTVIIGQILLFRLLPLRTGGAMRHFLPAYCQIFRKIRLRFWTAKTAQNGKIGL